MSTATAVVIGNHTQGLGIVRSAALAGAKVWVVNDKSVSLARCSRRLTGYKRIPRGTLGRLTHAQCAAQLREALLELPFEGPAALFGVNEDITRFIHRNRHVLRSRYFVPDVPFETIYDKFVFNSLLPEKARIETSLCSQVNLETRVSSDDYLLKGRTGNAFRKFTGEKAILLRHLGLEEQRRLFKVLGADQVVLQEVIQTTRPVRSVCSFAVNGRVVALFGYDKLRQHPNRFGTGTYLRSTCVESLQGVAEDIIAGLNYTGISEIEFIHDSKEDAYKVIEMNPRTWKSIHFATQCGENLVGRYLMHVSGQSVAARTRYQPDRYWADLATDIPQMFREMRIRGYHRGFFECTWDLHDPIPAVVLWTLFPLIAVENLLTSPVPKSEPSARPSSSCGDSAQDLDGSEVLRR